MLNKRLEFAFLGMIVFALVILANNYYSTKKFKDNPISDEYKMLITQKEQEILTNMKMHYGFSLKVPLIITDKFKNRLYGATVYKDGDIKIYLNKNVMKESMDYVLSSVIAHEYAHALMFMRKVVLTDDGHSAQWQDTCTKLGGLNCEKYVNTQEVVMGKMPF